VSGSAIRASFCNNKISNGYSFEHITPELVAVTTRWRKEAPKDMAMMEKQIA
jgi:hypothetical protein